jgi:hypothetical protein
MPVEHQVVRLQDRRSFGCHAKVWQVLTSDIFLDLQVRPQPTQDELRCVALRGVFESR